MEIETFYKAATNEEKQVMEAASAAVGRVSTKTEHGLVWAPMLDPETVTESVMARMRSAHPEAATKLEELVDIRATHVRMANIAKAEVRELVEGA